MDISVFNDSLINSFSSP